MPILHATQVLLSFDTEDFTSPADAEGIKEIAEICTRQNVTAHFATVGYVARQLVEWKREDVIEAMRPHVKISHTLHHSIHPNNLEVADAADWRWAYATILEREREGLDLIRSHTGQPRVLAMVPGGNCDAYLLYYAAAELGVRFYLGATFAYATRSMAHFANQCVIGYGVNFEEYVLPPNYPKYEPERLLDALAKYETTCLWCHPNIVHALQFWDGLNYNGRNAEWGKWVIAPRRSEADAKEYLRRIEDIIRRIKADRRFEFVTVEQLEKRLASRVAINRSDLPAIMASLAREFGPVRAPESWSVADVFAAAVGFLRGAERHEPGIVYGFLDEPEGVVEPVRVSRSDLVAAAEKVDLSTFLPSAIDVGSTRIGPADFLFAALDALISDAESLTVRPREQLGGFTVFPDLAKQYFKGTWLHRADFNDIRASDRLRLQNWTARYG
ncbi:MAG: hypothetical protein ACOX9C_11825 [Kiritimatiellia bacterium]|jgi:hypothetical protein